MNSPKFTQVSCGIITIVGMGFSLASYVAPANYFLEATSSLRMQYLCIGVVPMIFFTLTQRWRWVVASGLCVLINFAEILPWYVPNFSNPTVSQGQLVRVLQFNVLFSNQRYDDIINFVKQENPTIAVFLEVRKNWAKELQILDKFFPYQVKVPKLEIEIYSHLPLSPQPQVQLYGTYRGNVIVAVDMGHMGQKLTLIASHAYPGFSDYFGIQGFNWRNQQLEDLGYYLATLPKPVVLVGDFNATISSPYYKRVVQRSGMQAARAGYGVLPTLKTVPWFGITVDHCLVSRDIRVEHFRRGPMLGSDHHALITDLVIPVGR